MNLLPRKLHFNAVKDTPSHHHLLAVLNYPKAVKFVTKKAKVP